MSENLKKVIIIIVFFIIVAGLPLFFILRKKTPSTPKAENTAPPVEQVEAPVNPLESLIDSSRLIGGLPSSDERIEALFLEGDEDHLIEYISFLDFYKEQQDDFDLNIPSYQLPLNVKTEVLNYYDISRKINLDPYLDQLNNEGFALVNNPFDSGNFYDIYAELYQREIPLLITSDFLIYYYQTTLKKVFKDLEEHIFYDNLWAINYFLYNQARERYEESLARIGHVNDRVLEAERLSAAYFAVSLELLKPRPDQINSDNNIANTAFFSPFEVSNYTFVLPDYLKVDVERELDLIKEARQMTKSPVLLYQRNYQDFKVPNEYKFHAKLYNFYLTTKWLSSNFPLYYQGEDCPSCQLDFDDWRISLITATRIAQDIFDSYPIKNKWARIYKTLAFFKGLRGDLTYVHYRDALVSLFGDDYNISEIFADQNPEAINNMRQFRDKVLSYEFSEIEGGLKKDSRNRDKLGVKMLTEFYWPNDYIFSKLSYPQVLAYQGGSPSKSNITSCRLGRSGDNLRCNGFSLDIIALINQDSLLNNEYFLENSNYDQYQSSLDKLKEGLFKSSNLWHYNNYWKTLSLIKNYLTDQYTDLPFTKNLSWPKKELHTAIGAWIDLQLAPDQLKVFLKNHKFLAPDSETNFVNFNYIDPQIALINEQISNTEMIIEMFNLLKISEELRTVAMSLEDLRSNLSRVKEIMVKELQSIPLSVNDLNFINSLALEYRLDQAENKVLKIFGENNRSLSYDLGKPKLVVVITGNDEKRSFAVGPVFSYIERK